MPAELDRRADGRACIFTVKAPAWHREGVTLDEPPSLAAALRLGGLDYEVEKVPAYFKRGRGQLLQVVKSVSGFITIRTDRGEELGCVGRYYHPLQNLDAFAVLEPLLGQGLLALETGGVLRGGADAWLLGRLTMGSLPAIVQEVFGDEVLPYVLFANNHSGRRNATIAETPIRVVCANTLAVAERRMDGGRDRFLAVRHTRGAEGRVTAAAAELFQGVKHRYASLAADFRLLQECRLTRAQFRALVLDPVAPVPRPPASDGDAARAAFERATRRRAEVERLWTEGEGHAGALTAWEAYNALAQAIEHDASFAPTRRGSTRVQSMMDGRLGRLSRDTLRRLLAHAEAATR